MFYGDVKSDWEPLEMQAWLTKQSKQALSVPLYRLLYAPRTRVLLYVPRTCMLFLSEYARALYCVAFPVDMVAFGKVGCCVCMQRLFYASFFNSEHVWHVCGPFHKSVQEWQSGQMCGICLENFYIYSNLPDCHQCGLIYLPLIVGSYIQHYKWCRAGSQVGYVCIFVKTAKVVCWMHHQILRGAVGSSIISNCRAIPELVKNCYKLPAGRCRSIW